MDAAIHIRPERFQEEYGIIGESVEMRKIVEVIEQVAPTDITVLITGESGTGKEVIAKAIHAASPRNKKPLITVNCGAIPEGIIESELFGHERGSFTGASEQRKGYFELADGGSIFLDEVGELPLSAQVKFLRILENGEFLRVGSSVPRTVNVRVIAATNKNLELEVQAQRFRADLFYRLRSVNISIPPLRKRTDDIAVLFRHFVGEVSRKNKVPFAGISPDAAALLQSYHWPGNVRELRNVVESMLVLENGRYLQPEDVQKYLKEYHPAEETRNLPVPVGRSVEQAERELILRALLDIKGSVLELKNIVLDHVPQPDALRQAGGDPEATQQAVEPVNLSLEAMERRMIAEALDRYKGNRRVAARALHISERTLYRKIKEYGLEAKDGR
ncbi:MAG TPA: sigma-54 dependent transcriptional regulator [Bacteroidota bacterium]|nr:sigma-54 dependent transcriptional regulator [Bacteroidota bacterium]